MELTALMQNLIDAGCDKNLTEQIISLWEHKRVDEALSILSKHRKAVLENCHAEQKKIDCLDYLVYRIKKEN